jgi:hydrogenase maturation protease
MVRLVCCDGEPARMIDLWHGARLAIVVDAAVADSETVPGSVLRWESPGDEEGPRLRSDSGGSHALGPGTALRLADVLGRSPGRLVAFAVIGSDFDLGPGLSEPVAAAVGRVTAEIVSELLREGRSARLDRGFGPCPETAPTGRLVP